MCAQNFTHAHANFAHAHANFLHAHVRNHEICVQAQIGLARGRCSNTLVFFLNPLSRNIQALKHTFFNPVMFSH